MPATPRPADAYARRRTVGAPRDERPLQTLERLWRRHRALRRLQRGETP